MSKIMCILVSRSLIPIILYVCSQTKPVTVLSRVFFFLFKAMSLPFKYIHLFLNMRSNLLYETNKKIYVKMVCMQFGPLIPEWGETKWILQLPQFTNWREFWGCRREKGNRDIVLSWVDRLQTQVTATWVHMVEYWTRGRKRERQRDSCGEPLMSLHLSTH